MMRLDNELDWKQSRSKWVKSAILAKLDAHSDESQVIMSLSSKRLAVLLYSRGVIPYEMLQHIITMLPVEETVEEQ